MRLPKHKLPKIKSQHSQKDRVGQKLKAKIEKKAAKEVKAAQMLIVNDDESTKVQLTDQQKYIAKMERKQLNKEKVFYKKQNLNRTHHNGPRAVTK